MSTQRAEPVPTSQLVGDALACPRCGRPGLLTIRYPHTWHGRTGQLVRGFKEAVLCAVCDRGETAAEDVIALVDTQGQIGPGNTERFLHCAFSWIDHARGREPDFAVLAEEEQCWRSGEL
ncbi:DUF6300 family protein [Streptomyces lydicus]|uniref:DUF6300 family protein n=1 Tax=Streptomyces lydicus TaxID=47763 RepID=UPI0037B384CA